MDYVDNVEWKLIFKKSYELYAFDLIKFMALIKKELLAFVLNDLLFQKREVEGEIESLLEEIGKETKSSAGDKFETAREMMNQERNRLEERLHHLATQSVYVKDMQTAVPSKTVGVGSLVETEHNIFLFGVALGKIIFQEQEIFLLSLSSPIGKVFMGKEKGAKLNFMAKNYSIKSVF